MAGIRLGVLSGTVIIVPMEVEAKLPELLAQYGCSGTLNPLGDTGYGQLMIKGKSTHTVAVVTELFRQGEIHTLIGTKSLLGEGWDAPCINSLILATYVGSFMLSNQMRGRAIRTDREQPDKTGNIWHLACIFQKSGDSRVILMQRAIMKCWNAGLNHFRSILQGRCNRKRNRSAGHSKDNIKI